jgi:hypothetical protein
MAPYDSLNTAVIYDFETLSQNQIRGVVLSFAMLPFAPSRFTNPELSYTYEELLSKTKFIKFNVEEQVKKYDRKIEKKTLEWWSQQGDLAKKQLKPSSEDQSISELYSFFVLNKPVNLDTVYTRGNTFDPVFFQHIIEQTGNTMPYDWWMDRDTRSLIDGLSWGSGMKNSFMPPNCEDKFVHHDPCHDIVLDVMRLQTLVQAIS